MNKLIILSLILSLVPTLSRADADDDTLRFYLSKSDLVVIGKIVSEPRGVMLEAGVPNYLCDFEVEDVLKGNNKLAANVIKVNIMRFELDKKDRHPLIKKNSRSILFLKQQSEGTTPPRATSDFWFGIQHPFPSMAESLKRLSK